MLYATMNVFDTKEMKIGNGLKDPRVIIVRLADAKSRTNQTRNKTIK